MKKIVILLALLAGFQELNAQSCCFLKKDDMQLMASNKAFQRSHKLPKPYVHVSKAGGEMMEFSTPDGQKARAFYIKAAKPSQTTLFVFQEWWGLNDHIKREAEHFYSTLGNVNVMAIDMYDGKVATTREDAGKYMGEANPARLEAIIKGAIQHVGPKAKIATVGWCFGGGLSLKASILAGKQGVACVMYYGMPVKDVNELKALNTDVLGLFAGKEQWISPKVVSEFQDNMKAAGKNLQVKSFDAEHAFANPSNPAFDKKATEEAWNMAIAFFKERIK
ncbi:dienelactone hydrolase family protein [Aquirufa rosea]|uniref:Dienelactone hydrolase n=1 Tax=Aquirufa rosea TaxID=2509241 RepID=A0A4Q1C1G0_9BACT|nr:dienelactone hydrolase family protein [Aquirufa rosea]RXK50982.1 dienelactone hydrolase [Aquirufa rosea]